MGLFEQQNIRIADCNAAISWQNVLALLFEQQNIRIADCNFAARHHAADNNGFEQQNIRIADCNLADRMPHALLSVRTTKYPHCGLQLVTHS
jgi:hypothetical protein